MKAVIVLDVPEYQIGRDATVYFPDTMLKHGKCESLKEQENQLLIKHEEGFHDGYTQALSELHSKQFEKVVRCKDCKYGEPWGVLIGCGKSKGFGITHNQNWFCADGERKEVE